MPTRFREDDKPVVEFDPRLEVSPFALFRRLREGPQPMLIDVRAPGSSPTLVGALPWPGDDWCPPEQAEVVIFDDDGSLAFEQTRRLREKGHARVRALFGGLDLYAFALDPQVVGRETYLRHDGA